jgi:hypothetical protein
MYNNFASKLFEITEKAGNIVTEFTTVVNPLTHENINSLEDLLDYEPSRNDRVMMTSLELLSGVANNKNNELFALALQASDMTYVKSAISNSIEVVQTLLKLFSALSDDEFLILKAEEKAFEIQQDLLNLV